MALQLALAMVPLSGAGLMLRSFLDVQKVDLGYQPQGLFILHLDVPAEQNVEAAQFYQGALARIRALSGVQDAGSIDALFSDYVPDDVIEVEGRPNLSGGDEAAASGSHVVSERYFQTAAVPLLRGRFFDSSDGPHSLAVAIINQSMAKRFWPGGNPIGQRFRYGVPGESPSVWRAVIGIVGDTLADGPESQIFPQFFLPQSQLPWTASMDIVVRARQEQLPLADSIRSAILSVKPDINHFDVSTVESEIETLGNRRRFQTWLLNVFSAVALVLAAVGIYGLFSYSVAERTSEIGIRMALGADRLDIMRMIFRQLITLVGSGLLLGLAGALVLARAISSLLFGVPWMDVRTLVLATSLLCLVAVAAAYIPARRATMVDPVIALSSE
jgi:putative ABC transport system permease protein